MRILAIQTFPAGSPAAFRHYPFYERAGADRIIGITTEGGKCDWPTEDVLEIGPDSYVRGAHLCQRLISTIAACHALGADEIIVAEYDTLFFKPIPPLPPGLTMNVTGGNSANFKGQRYYHGPWCMGRETAQKVIEAGNTMIAAGDIEHGWPDRFIGWLAEAYGFVVNEDVFVSYTQNTLDSIERMKEARAARIEGCHAIHGIKSAAQLEFILL